MSGKSRDGLPPSQEIGGGVHLGNCRESLQIGDRRNCRIPKIETHRVAFDSSLPGWVGGSSGSFLRTIPRRSRFCSRENQTRHFVTQRGETPSLHVPVGFEVQYQLARARPVPVLHAFRGVKTLLPAGPQTRGSARGGSAETFYRERGGGGGMAAFRCYAKRSTETPTATDAGERSDLVRFGCLCFSSCVSFFFRSVSWAIMARFQDRKKKAVGHAGRKTQTPEPDDCCCC